MIRVTAKQAERFGKPDFKKIGALNQCAVVHLLHANRDDFVGLLLESDR
jgi:hypothetical protein